MLVLRRTSMEAGDLGTINVTWRLLGRNSDPAHGYEGSQLSTQQLQKEGLHPQHSKNEEWDKRQKRGLSQAKPLKNPWEIKIESGQ